MICPSMEFLTRCPASFDVPSSSIQFPSGFHWNAEVKEAKIRVSRICIFMMMTGDCFSQELYRTTDLSIGYNTKCSIGIIAWLPVAFDSCDDFTIETLRPWLLNPAQRKGFLRV